MIVKNESHVIRRCLASVKPIIDYWVIVDTGSTDGTQDIIRDFLKDIPGELHERQWVNFGHNRNQALDYSRGKADYMLFIDADDRLVFDESFAMPELTKAYYLTVQKTKNHLSGQPVLLLVKDQPDLKWEGVLHEVLPIYESRGYAYIDGVFNEYNQDGYRSRDPDKYRKDACMLEQALMKDPSNTRTAFYLAQSYLGACDYPEALRCYSKRAEMGGAPEEVFYSLYNEGWIQLHLKAGAEKSVHSLCKAFQFRPTRIEPLYALTWHYMAGNNFFLGYLISKLAISIPLPIDLFVETWMYEWGVLEQHFHCSLELRKLDEALAALKKLLANPKLPADHRAILEKQLPQFQANGASA